MRVPAERVPSPETVELDPHKLLDALGLEPGEVPAALILEGSWWQRERNASRLGRLERVRELGFPELHLGWWDGVPILYSCVYGAPRAVEPVHLFGALGARLAIVIGSCGALQPQIRLGDVVLPTRARIGEGASRYYGGGDWAEADEAWVDRAEKLVTGLGLRAQRGPFVTTSALFAQTPELIEGWTREGYLGVDMETSAVFSAAHACGLEAVSLVFAWDELHRGRSFLDPLDEEERGLHERANDGVFTAALSLAAEAARERPARAASSRAVRSVRDDRDDQATVDGGV